MDGIKLNKIISKKELKTKISELSKLIDKKFLNEEIVVDIKS